MASSEGRQVSLQPVPSENLLRRLTLSPLLSVFCFLVVLFEMNAWFSFLAFLLHRIRERFRGWLVFLTSVRISGPLWLPFLFVPPFQMKTLPFSFFSVSFLLL